MLSLVKVPKNSTFNRIFISKNHSKKTVKKAIVRQPTSDPENVTYTWTIYANSFRVGEYILGRV